MNRRQKIIVSVTGIFLVLLLLVGLTYAYFLTQVTGNTNSKSISVSTANLAVVYGGDDGSVIGKDEVILPGTTFESKTFTVTNNGNATTDYVVVIEILEGTSTFVSNDFTYTLTCSSNVEGNTCESVDAKATFPISGGILVGNSIEEGEVQTYSFTMTYEETGENQTDDMNKTLNALINIKDISTINPYSDNTSTLAYNIINNSMLGANGTTLLGAPETAVAEVISLSEYGKTEPIYYPSTKTSITTTNTYTYASDYTIDSSGKFTLVDPQTVVYADGYETLKGKYIVNTSGASDTAAATSTSLSSIFKVSPTDVTATSFNYISVNKYISNEKVLLVAQDDYGTSYYYRGGVEDNYVTYADMCWRIVRIAGDGSIKLVLEDQDNTCEASTGNWNIPTTTGGTTTTGNYGYTQYSSGGLTASDGTTTNTSTKYIMDYLHGTTNSAKSMATAFKNFQNTFTTEELAKLKSGDWCMADNGYSGSGSSGSYEYTLLNDAQMLDNKVAGTTFYYDSYTRLNSRSANGYQPTLKCTGTVMNDWDDTDKTAMYVGALTADEIVYAGGKAGANNYSYYLLNDYQRGKSLYFWSLSPSYFGSTYDFAFVVSSDGRLNNLNVSSSYSFRPSVSLASGAVITSGNGTLENPYIIG